MSISFEFLVPSVLSINKQTSTWNGDWIHRNKTSATYSFGLAEPTGLALSKPFTSLIVDCSEASKYNHTISKIMALCSQ